VWTSQLNSFLERAPIQFNKFCMHPGYVWDPCVYKTPLPTKPPAVLTGLVFHLYKCNWQLYGQEGGIPLDYSFSLLSDVASCAQNVDILVFAWCPRFHMFLFWLWVATCTHACQYRFTIIYRLSLATLYMCTGLLWGVGFFKSSGHVLNLSLWYIFIRTESSSCNR